MSRLKVTSSWLVRWVRPSTRATSGRSSPNLPPQSEVAPGVRDGRSAVLRNSHADHTRTLEARAKLLRRLSMNQRRVI
jgi:hypothetical protein